MTADFPVAPLNNQQFQVYRLVVSGDFQIASATGLTEWYEVVYDRGSSTRIPTGNSRVIIMLKYLGVLSSNKKSAMVNA